MMYNINVTVLLFWAIYLIAFVLGYLISEKLNNKPFGMFSVYPFRCRRCCTTQLMAVLYISTAVVLDSWVFGGLGLLVTIGQGIEFIYGDKQDGLM